VSHPGERRIPLDVPIPDAAGIEGDPRHPTTELGYCLVTGAAGFLGRSLVRELLRRGERVRAFDIQPIEERHERLYSVQGDLLDPDDVRKTCEGIDTVFHTAALLDFATFASAAQRERSLAVNVRAVQGLIDICRDAGVSRLVHTSSNNVTFGEPVIDGDETLPYAWKTGDLYTRTKIMGEKTALDANAEEQLLTCAIRPGGIYGPGDPLQLSRLVDECAAGRFVALIGDGSALSDNTYIDNLVDGEIEAARHLLPGSPLCGQAYFITDGNPINYFEFFRPLVEGMGFRFPRLRVPGGLMAGVAFVWEFLHWSLRFPRPALNRLEVRKITRSHYNRIDKARRDFGWQPPVTPDEATERCLVFCRERLAGIQARAGNRGSA
jgi:3beta-hydroxy-delta5-steroid dehydrogenase/steroid delta-isomerase